MSDLICTAIMIPGDSETLLCVDGLSVVEKFNIVTLLNFGGKLHNIQCGAQKEYEMIKNAYNNMTIKYEESNRAGSTVPFLVKKDYYNAM